MLKLEKTSDLSGLAIQMRERERFFEPRVLKAFLIALFLHTSGLLLFHAAPFDFSSNYLFPPIQVQMDSPLQGVSVLAGPTTEIDDFLPPPISFVPAMDQDFLPKNSVLAPYLEFDPHAFNTIESHLWPKWEEPLLPLKEPWIKLSISGDLAHHPLITSNPLLEEVKVISPTFKEAYAHFRVLLDAHSGELFWYERIDVADEMQAMNMLAESILTKLRFQPSSGQDIDFVEGELHFAMLIDKEEE